MMKVSTSIRPILEWLLIKQNWLSPKQLEKLLQLYPAKNLEEILIQRKILPEETLQLIVNEIKHQTFHLQSEVTRKMMLSDQKKEKSSHQTVLVKQPAGKTFGKYEILEKLAQGGMGIVYKVYHRELKQIYALKVLLSEALDSSDAVSRFYREAQTAAKLKHPNIVQVIDFGEEQGQQYLVMEYVEGETLASLIQKGLSVREGLILIQKALEALEYAHSQGIIHRDLKPVNIFV
ncbi:MAG: serine/threonine-protein kinase, partial [Planctomycetota bacterium]